MTMESKQFIKKTRITPEVRMDLDTGEVHIVGESAPENPTEFFRPFKHFIGESILKNNKIHLHFDLNYFNTSSAKMFVELFDTMESFYNDGADCAVYWQVTNGDSDMIEAGEDLLDGLLFPYEILGV